MSGTHDDESADLPEEIDLESSDESPARGGAPAWLVAVAIILGLLGLILGYVAWQGQGTLKRELAAARAEVQKLRAEMTDTEAITAQASGATEAAQGVSDRLDYLVRDHEKTKRQLQQVVVESQRAFDGFGSELASAKEQMAKLLEQGVRVSPSRSSASLTRTGNPPAVEEPLPEGAYRIQEGDTLSAIAKRFGISLSAIFDANPGIDPMRLRPGQTIQLPTTGVQR